MKEYKGYYIDNVIFNNENENNRLKLKNLLYYIM